ncbi:hypothetical protein T02_16512 [Trichinella nativa]|uniref:Uncharacterized protein n=1 Tax=Trichinella nativa TaxID=6335 RepID=A0A0V1KKP2_9BILA|nr:hypothetical protein T02_12377 [Trichinella nativa]KRZ56291.1 hypothetical protein T02_16512 [Trichinella nativa]
MVDQELQFYVNYGVFSQGSSVYKNLKLFFHFFTIFLEIRNRATWCQADSNLTVAPINGLKLNIISMLTFPEICYYAISDLFNAVQRLRGRVEL